MAQIVHLHLVDSAVDAHARVVDQNVHAAEVILGLADHLSHLRLIGHIHRQGQRAHTVRLAQTLGQRQDSLLAERCQHQMASFLGQRLGHRRADPPASAGHDCRSIFQFHLYAPCFRDW